MIIELSPQRRDDALTVVKSGDILTINGDEVDLSGIPDGADLPAAAIDNPWIAGPVRRVDGVLHVPLLLPHGANAGEQARFPSDIVDAPDGEILLPHDEAAEVDHGDN